MTERYTFVLARFVVFLFCQVHVLIKVSVGIKPVTCVTVLHGNEVQHMGLHSHTSSVVSIYVTRFKKEVWG